MYACLCPVFCMLCVVMVCGVCVAEVNMSDIFHWPHALLPIFSHP